MALKARLNLVRGGLPIVCVPRDVVGCVPETDTEPVRVPATVECRSGRVNKKVEEHSRLSRESLPNISQLMRALIGGLLWTGVNILSLLGCSLHLQDACHSESGQD